MTAYHYWQNQPEYLLPYDMDKLTGDSLLSYTREDLPTDITCHGKAMSHTAPTLDFTKPSVIVAH